ncbi:hypothetical protein FQN60_010515, partial [Etheostoma spectabile]
MNNAVIQPLVNCGASEELETPRIHRREVIRTERRWMERWRGGHERLKSGVAWCPCSGPCSPWEKRESDLKPDSGRPRRKRHLWFPLAT